MEIERLWLLLRCARMSKTLGQNVVGWCYGDEKYAKSMATAGFTMDSIYIVPVDNFIEIKEGEND